MKAKYKNIKNLKETLWKYLREYILLKYPVCQICMQREIDDVHHIIKKSVCEYLRFDEDNLIALCRVCHHKAHPERRYAKGFDALEWSEILIRIIGNDGIEYLQSHRHDPKNWWSEELIGLINEYKKKIKELGNE